MAKKAETQRLVIKDAEGIFIEDDAERVKKPTCGIEKDKGQRLNIRSAENIIHDDGCHLKKYALHRRSITSNFILQLTIVVDKFHMKEQTDKWCKENCDPNNIYELGK
uniref:Uncharacterized protein n=1 Tax=Amphimedon queenslandica TaxID=400682 RepID=A0A1X7UDR9_AMPQE